MAAPITMPSIPLVTPIPGGFLSGKLVRLEGAISPSAQRFAINLQCGPNTSPRDDIGLHFSVNLANRSVARNSLNLGQWGEEESHGGFPLQQGEGFEILFLANSNQYKIAINGQHFTEFNHRMPPERISHLAVDGDVLLTLVSFEGTSLPKSGSFSTSASEPAPTAPQGLSATAPILPSSSPAPVQNTPYGAPPGVSPYPPQSGAAPYPPAAAASPYGMPPYPPQSNVAPYPTGYPASAPSGPYPPAPQHYPGAPYGQGQGQGLYPQVPGAYPPAPGPYPPAPGPYPQAPGPYAQGPGYPQGPYPYGQGPAGPYPGAYGPYPGAPGGYPPAPGQYPGADHSGHNKGFGGLLGKAGAAVAGALGATGLLGLAGSRAPTHSYPYPAAGPAMGSGGGGILGAASSAIGAAALGQALLNPKKAMKKQHKAQKNAMKYGIPAAGIGLGAYALHKGLKHGFHGGSGSSSSSSEEE